MRIRRPRAHWSLLALCAVVLGALLLIQGFAERRVGASGTAEPSKTTGALPDDATVLVDHGGRLTARHRDDRREVALTFDDGPDAKWTPRIAAELRRLRVPATFFSVGAQVARHRGITAALHRDGFEIGTHTFTHADLTSAAGWQRREQLELTDAAITGAAGVRPRLFRPPYSSTPRAVT